MTHTFTGRDFPEAAPDALADEELRATLHRVTRTIRGRTQALAAEVDDWQELRGRARQLKTEVMADLDRHLLELEESVTRAGGQVHWAADAASARRQITELVQAKGTDEVVKVKSLTTAEIELDEALAAAGIRAVETDLAELILQLADDRPSHILVPSIHHSAARVRELFSRTIADRDLGNDPAELAAVARSYLRERFLRADVAISGANFAIAETGQVGVVESEGNGRMCLTLPSTLITVMGIEKVLRNWDDLSVILRLLPRASTGERMNPYTTIWRGVDGGDGPDEFHLVLLDNGRTDTLADEVGRQALHCIRCSACLNICPVYARAGGHSYDSVYPGPIGSILSPQLDRMQGHRSLPFASTLCGACADVCPVGIEIPELLVHLRHRVVAEPRGARERLDPERAAFAAIKSVMSSRKRYERAQRWLRLGRRIDPAKLPGPLAVWSKGRELPPIPRKTFRELWAEQDGGQGLGGSEAGGG